MRDEIRFGIVGSGMGQNRARMVARTNGARLVAICTLDIPRGRRIAEELKCELIPDYDDMLARDDIDVVGILTPSGLHGEFAVKAMRAGKHVFVTKPMDIRVERCDEMIRVSKETGKILAVDFDLRYSPVNHRIRQAIWDGKLGRIFLGDMRMKWYRSQEYYDGGFPPKWRSKLETEGGSAANQGVHFIDLLQWWLGPVSSVYGRAGTFAHDIETEDNTNALITFRNGAWGIIQTSTSIFPDLGTTIEISGDKGTIIWKDGEVTLFRTMDEEHPSLDIYDVDPKMPRNIVEDMIMSIVEGRKPMCSSEEGRESVAIFCAIYESARTGKVVELA